MARFDSPSSFIAAPRVPVAAGVFALLLSAAIAVGGTAAQAAGRCASSEPKVLAQSAPGRITFGSKTRMVMIKPVCGAIGTAVRRAGAKTRFFLVVEDLRTSAQPGAIFDISLAPSHGSSAGHTRMLGTLNFFNAHPAAAGEGRRVSYDVTTSLKALAGRDRLTSGLALAIAPLSRPSPSSDASARAIRLVVQPDGSPVGRSD